MATPAPPTLPDPPSTHHLIAGRGKSFGGIVGLGLWAFSWGLWAYLWGVVAAVGVTFVRSNYDIEETLETSLRLIIYPFVSVPMHLFIVWPYEWLYCPLHYWWAKVSIPLVKSGASTLDQKTRQQQYKMFQNWSAKNASESAKLQKDMQELWKKETGSTWFPYWAPGTVDETSDPNYIAEANFAAQYGYDIAAPIYDAKHGYKEPTYCDVPDDMVTGKTDPYRKGCDNLFPSMFSLEYWFCRDPKFTQCTVKCSTSPS